MLSFLWGKICLNSGLSLHGLLFEQFHELRAYCMRQERVPGPLEACAKQTRLPTAIWRRSDTVDDQAHPQLETVSIPGMISRHNLLLLRPGTVDLRLFQP